ncbi:flavoprotein [Streptomyces lonarensis]|uniref:Flavoprotein n=2 Tax=Streptomyces lonarensis TaxID=700599 RepID=A0A7X6D4V6_9ACTN|nr:flavoprotein [Streptomyces lonarensis]NJQ08210.1 flavoprotein [Streptomyces lonarensis]
MDMPRVLYLIATAAGPTQFVDRGVRVAQEAGWDVCLVFSPIAATWWWGRMDELEALTGHPVRHRYTEPDEDAPDVPPADAMLVAPLTTTSLCRWGAGITDSLSIGLPAEAVHLGTPVVAMPYWSTAIGTQPAVPKAVATLREQGVRVLLGEGGFEPHHPRADEPAAFPWKLAVEALG